MPLYAAGLWLAVNIAPGQAEVAGGEVELVGRGEPDHDDVGAGLGGALRERRRQRRRRRPHVVAHDHRRGAGHLGVRAARRPGQRRVDLLGGQTPDVVRLEDGVDDVRIQVWHAPNPSQEQQTSWSEVADGVARTRLVPGRVEGLAVLEHGVDLPGLAVRGALDPELVLLGVAARRAPLVDRREPVGRQPALDRVDGVDVLDLDAEVVERPAVAGVLDENELERRLGDGEVRVAGPDLGRLGVEEPGVERDRRRQVVDVEGQLHTGHLGVLLGHRQ